MLKRISLRLLILLTFTVSSEWLQAQISPTPPNVQRHMPRGPRKPELSQLQHPLRPVGPSILPASISPDVVSVQCPPRSTCVKVAEAGHLTVLWTQCAVNLLSQFLESLQVGDTSCTKTPETVWPALGRFPLVAADARPAEVDSAGSNEVDLGERRVVTVAVATITDALKRRSIGNGGSGNGVGLRAGAFRTSFDSTGDQTITLSDCVFANDVTVKGTVLWRTDRSLVADVTVTGTGTAGGILHVEGAFQLPGPVGTFKISGTLGGREVGALVPEE